MTTSKTAQPTSARKGRPNSRDQEYILAHFSTQLALGRTIKAIADDGIPLFAHEVLPDETVRASIEREVKGAILERRYRALRKAMIKHTEEFKQEAVRIARTSGLPRDRVASALGIGKSTLGKWVSQYRPSDLGGSAAGRYGA